MDKVKLSIILPIYNVEHFLKRCLETINCQLIGGVEVILVNDGSTDDCENICEAYVKKNRSFIYLNQKNTGVSAARNRGIEVATGKYIAFIDPDDTISKTYIQDILLETQSEPDILILKYKKIIGGEQLEGPYNMWTEGSISIKKLKKAIAYLFLNEVWNKVFKREIIQQHNIRFNSAMKIAEDICFVMDYMEHVESAKVAKGIYYNYWLNEESAVRTVRSEQLCDLMTLYMRLLDFSECNGMQDGSANQPSDFVLQNIAELVDEGKYSRDDVITRMRESQILIREKQYIRKGSKNKLLYSWLTALDNNHILRAKFYNFVIKCYNTIKERRK